MKKILLVGGAGYVGTVLAEELLVRGYAVRILDRLYYGRQGLRDIKDRIELVVDDMRTFSPRVLENLDAVINVGGLSNDPTAEYNPTANYEMNTLATQRLAEMCKGQGIRRFIFASTCSIYDRGVSDGDIDIVQDEESEVSPQAAYSSSKYKAERILLDMADDDFCPIILRKGTVFGFSPRMRYDLVVNTFVKYALTEGRLTLHYGGEMWRPLINVRDAARAYITCLQAEETAMRGQIFNISQGNYRISELALRVQAALREVGVEVEIYPDYGYRGVRSYRVSTRKIEHMLGFRPVVTVEESVKELVHKIREYGYTDFDNPRYYNIHWMKLLEEAQVITQVTGSVFEAPSTLAVSEVVK
ncbi:MAG: NAD(P)-dependent oxidoreductase [Anaerolineae bacterium]|nr:NAD(P)-dependent oxidoreductase [Anaerolineae bacterium]